MSETAYFLSERFCAEVFCPKRLNAEVFDVNVCSLRRIVSGTMYFH